MSKRNVTIDVIRVFAALGVVFIHFQPRGFLGSALYTLGRFAVPYFFMVAGFFFKGNSEDYSECIRKSKRLFVLILVALILYIPFNFIYYHGNYLRGRLTLSGLFRIVVLNAPQLTKGHIWFLPALIYCYFIYHFLQKRLKRNHLLLIAGTLLAIHLFVSGVLPVFFHYDKINAHSAIYRNAYLLGLPFFIIGNHIQTLKEKISEKPGLLFIAVGVIGALLSIFEARFNHQRLYIGTIVFSVCVFALAIKYPMYDRDRSLLYKIGHNYSQDVYIVHIIFGTILKSLLNSGSVLVDYLIVFGAYALSVIVGIVRVSVEKRIKKP